MTPVKDGYFEVITMVDDQWNRFLDLLGDPEWRDDERLKNRWLAFQHADELDALWHPWMRERTKAELWKQFSENRISFQPVHSIGEVAESEHLRARESAGWSSGRRRSIRASRTRSRCSARRTSSRPARGEFAGLRQCWGSTQRRWSVR